MMRNHRHGENWAIPRFPVPVFAAVLVRLTLALAAGCVVLSAQTEPVGARSVLAQAGLTVAPYLQVLSPESIALLWQTDQPAYGWVDYGETKALGLKQDAVVNGLRRANVTEHRVVLTGLRPGTTYWYRVVYKPILFFAAYKVEFGPERSLELRSFQTLPTPQQPVSAVIFNDLHNNLETFRQLRQTLGDTPFDFTLFNGDCFADPSTEKTSRAILSALTQGVQADSHPAFFLRGNHETRGAFARDLPRFFAWPADKPYFAFTAGPVRWVVIDCGEDKPDNHAEYFGLVDFTSFRNEETAWLKQELASRSFRQARWHVVVHHLPIYARPEQGRPPEPYQVLWDRLLAKARIDLEITAHTHHAAFFPAKSIGKPYPTVVGGNPDPTGATVLVLEADRRQLKLRTLNAESRDVFPAFIKRK